MPSLYEILADAQQGEAMTSLGNQFGLTPQQTQAAVAALLPAISMGLKQSTATPEGLGNLFALMAQQPDLLGVYDDPRVAYSPGGRAAGNAALSTMFGSPDASRAIAAQAQNLSGVTSTILKKLLPVIAGMIISGLMRSGSGQAAPQAPRSESEQGGGLFDILRQVFGQGQQPEATGQQGSSPHGIPPIGDILGSDPGGTVTPRSAPPMPKPSDPVPMPTDPGGGTVPGGDVLGQILRELQKGISEGRIKPVIVGPYEIDVPGKSGPSSPNQPPIPGGDILGQILRDMLGGKASQAQLPGQTSGLGSAVFGDQIEAGGDVDQSQIESLQEVFDRFIGTTRR
ncbi:MAG TPA: DUF937 domain-containing protein [Methyloceanibacter sp.]|nr:DUF937 domain-containing protein [Methyloceanibacter sp.]